MASWAMTPAAEAVSRVETRIFGGLNEGLEVIQRANEWNFK